MTQAERMDEALIPLASEEYSHLRRRLHRRVLEGLEGVSEHSVVDRVALIRHLQEHLDDLLASHGRALADGVRSQLLGTVADEIQGLGPITELMLDPRISDILINGYNDIWVDRNGRLERTSVAFDGNDHLLRFLNRILSQQGRHIDMGNPIVDARLSDGSRLNAVIAPPSPRGPVISIRRFRLTPLTSDDLIERDFMTPAMWAYLSDAICQGANMVIAGGSSAGKTSLLNVLSGQIPLTERIITIEETQELTLDHPHVVTLESRLGNGEGLGVIRLTDLLKTALRMRADRIIVGEVRGDEVFDMLQAMNVGHDGSMTTVHANSPRDVLNRFEYLALKSLPTMPPAMIQQMIASAIDVIVHLQRDADGHRRIASIATLTQSDTRTELEIRFQAASATINKTTYETTSTYGPRS
ncbi:MULTISPECIES: CpaF family protein [unclassified Oceanobacter]|uniref:CpaF family protein n=1 Tax=unclassified Oceanobacter TaxID=2620260 RepID=UPI0026E3EBB9|nr:MULTISPECIES: CpaF family protein [unclassified Oceanobacter]MDO6681483.1 CpaF family protein [Oceanobacter sp. 5_MG-2023]MDP2548653.1 CpaF family protein [Oceanobacter sp. 4_MG-2023]MDP2609284.1 CpaF family protein [Oceanobacter sp. 1_MG-2023]MDP2612619.1 CpaF family protein [Oceanobacter sp. 2_MG-2023]